MKILRIKLRNLNSLRGEHVVDFTRPPLAGASIFAITGPTGAGKSTLLDAMTLALYGQAARYENASNPENMMSRHSADCLAEVCFSVSGEIYRAEWQLHRAKGKADGKIQKPTRYLYDSSETPLNRLPTECSKVVEKITGLDYNRFLRSVLLAQGEFSRFLKADANERAGLLESLTGTEIYSQLGKLTHEEFTRRESELAAVKSALGHIPLLDDEQLAEKSTLLQSWTQKMQSTREQIEQYHQQLQRGEALSQSSKKIIALDLQQESLAQEKRDNAPLLNRLSLHQKALPFAARLTALDAAMRQQQSSRDVMLRAAEKLLEIRQESLNTLFLAIQFSEDAVKNADLHCAELRLSLQTTESSNRNLESWLRDHAHHAILADSLPALSRQGNQLHALSLVVQQAQLDLKSLDSERKKLQQTMRLMDTESMEKNTALASAELARKSSQQKLIEELCSPLVEDAAITLQTLRERETTLRGMLARAEAIVQESATTANLVAQLTEITAECLRCAATVADFEEQKRAAETAQKLRRDHLNLAERMANLDEQRSLLQEGEPCPLCGSAHHPFKDGAEQSHTLLDIRLALAAAEKHSKLTEKKLAESQKHQLTQEANAQSLKKNLDARQSAVTVQKQLLQQHAEALELTETSQAALTGLVQKCSERITRIEHWQKQWREDTQELTRATHALETIQSRKTDTAERCAELEKSLLTRQASIEEKCREREMLGQQLREALAPFQLAWSDDAEHGLSMDAWQQASALYQQYQRKLDEGRQHFTLKSQQLTQSEKTLTECRKLAAEWRARLPQNAPQPSALSTSQIPASWLHHRDAEQAYQEKNHAAASALTEAELYSKQHTEATELCEQRRVDLELAIAGGEFADLTTLRAAVLPTAQEQQFSAMAAELEQRSRELQTLLAEQQRIGTDLKNLNAPDEQNCARLLEEKIALTTRLEAMLRDHALLEEELRRDSNQRAEHLRMSTQLAEQICQLENWRILRDLIGSHDGAKFRRFAQGVSLDILTHHANQHLRKLSQRYLLQRLQDNELALEIIDIDQASTTRPMASLSGGETFLVSLALALGLSDLAGRNVQIDSLFIDEGFGTLDADALDAAISTLEALHQENKTIGIISHVELLKERISTKIMVRKLAGGTSTLECV